MKRSIISAKTRQLKKAASFLLLLTMGGWCSSCNKFLEADLDKSQIVTDKVFSTDVTATAAVTALYNTMNSSSMNGMYTGMSALAGLSAGDLTNYGHETTLLVFEQHAVLKTSDEIRQLWNDMYNIIYQASAILEGLHSASGLTPGVVRQLEGEARFVRAYTYFYLVNLFGAAPLVTTTDYKKNSLLSRAPVDELYALIENDLLSAQGLLVQAYPTAERVRPNRATATALLSRVYLYRKKYADAATQAAAVIDDPTYSLSSDLTKTFLIASTETIWQLMPVESGYNTTEGEYFILNGPPDFYNNLITTSLRNHFEPGDARRYSWINSAYYLGDSVYYPFKYKKREKLAADAYTECSVAFRLPELYLIRAEARANLNDLPGAKADLDAIRLRVGLPGTTAADQPGLLLAIEGERQSEFFAENCHRWFDLKRTGRALAVLGNGITEEDLLYPVPFTEFQLNPNLGKQNPGY